MVMLGIGVVIGAVLAVLVLVLLGAMWHVHP